MKLTRREFAKLSSIAAATILLPFSIIGCGVDAVISALQVAAEVAASAAGILGPLNAHLGNVLKEVSADLLTVVDLYKKYDSAAGDKPTVFQLIQATIKTITENLSEILSAVHIFNPALTTIIRTAVAIVNTAIALIISHLPQQHQAQARMQRLMLPALPDIPGAKNADDLRKAWKDAKKAYNDAVKAEHPEAVIH